MVAKKSTRVIRRNKSSHAEVVRSRGPRGIEAMSGNAGQAEAATADAWNAVKKAARSGRVQPATAARATKKAVRNIARAGAVQTSAAADAIVRAAEDLLVSSMREAKVAAVAAREAANEVERSVGAALEAIRVALRKRGHVAVNQVTRKRLGARARRPGR